MPISPITPSSSGYSSATPDPAVQEFSKLWNDWYNHPTKESAEALLACIQKNHDHFAELAKHTPQPHPFVDFEHSFDSAVKTVQAWIDHGCDPNRTSAPSEFVADIAKWINYAGM